jgi:putative hydrolase of the HAD superfamily
MKAIVFDYFGTLTDPSTESLRHNTFIATAGALGVPAEQFWLGMSSSFPQRVQGHFGGTRETLLEIARRCGHNPVAAQLDDAVRVQHEGAALMQRPRPAALAVLESLRAKGLRLGLISDCSSELCELWPRNPFSALIEAPVFSWRERCRKPDQRLYLAAASRLGVHPSQCLYVGDGGSREHQGATLAGMHPVLVTNAAHPAAAALRDDPDPTVPEHTIDDLPALLPLLGRLTRPPG